MKKCTHELWDMEAACADGMCPYCLAGEVTRLNKQVRELKNQIHKANSIRKLKQSDFEGTGFYGTGRNKAGWRIRH